MLTPDRAKRILVVDDEMDVRALLLATLEDAGYDVDLASDGVLALARILAHRPDLVVLDLMMPGMDGHELIAKLAAVPSSPPIIAIFSALSRTRVSSNRRSASAPFLLPTRPINGWPTRNVAADAMIE